jgi:hypothetical protein
MSLPDAGSGRSYLVARLLPDLFPPAARLLAAAGVDAGGVPAKAAVARLFERRPLVPDLGDLVTAGVSRGTRTSSPARAPD